MTGVSSSSVAMLRVYALSRNEPVSTETYVRRIFSYAFLAPDIVEAILDGRQPQDLTLEKLRKKLPMSWAEQRTMLLPSAQRSSGIN